MKIKANSDHVNIQYYEMVKNLKIIFSNKNF